ncbi:GTP 3',8-cyclase MoaA [Mucilaginibacter polytrichastri]|uniref:GTP 3',8-cyclase n=1 Tax=Mucilaginibacter polytrichastri TaxID=1302689 RepID=A0A1Q5ZU89_9SPHI|nr:GTP 3',8-cyclase MoaA [Mucilaginibacter polytrichastri]OKS85341.1 Molybdenum cofactor biosynthesis protein 1 [Mucilaginibacter polytrichastri]SFS40472.1 cyclic pyranopterin monophosphate synthase subunit MoaA [Mucilaginibacter polytrichastri]
MKESLLVDQHGRRLNYLRLSVTDRCNFRCYYCMPEEGINFAPRKDLLSFEEMYQLSSQFVGLGIDKIRITGGEPFVRNGIIPFLYKLSKLNGLQEITITSNGTLSTKNQASLKEMGIRKINISLDSLDATRFHRITRRDSFDTVYKGIFGLLNDGFEVKLNCVVAENKNIEDIVPFIELTKDHPLSVRFLEEMPFNGSEVSGYSGWDYKRIYEHINQQYTDVNRLISEDNSTSVNYKIPGYTGSFGIIPSFSRTFCGTCNRIRLSATGELRTCLYGPPAANLRDIMRSGANSEELQQVLLNAVAKREKDGYAAEALSHESVHTSMSALGG